MVIAVTPLLLLDGQIRACRGQPVTVKQPRRVCHADRMAGGVAEAKIGVWLRIRPVRAKDEHVNAEHAEYGVDSAVAVAGCFDEHPRIDHTPRQRVGSAAGGQALAMQRPETCQGGEADPQPRVGRPAVGAEREPGRVQLLNVGDEGGPPRRAARLAAAAGQGG